MGVSCFRLRRSGRALLAVCALNAGVGGLLLVFVLLLLLLPLAARLRCGGSGTAVGRALLATAAMMCGEGRVKSVEGGAVSEGGLMSRQCQSGGTEAVSLKMCR